MKRRIKHLTAAVIAAATLTGCVGSNAVTENLMKFNLKAVDNRYGRGGLNMLLSPIYGLTIALDYVIFNSIEFWSGTNPINGKKHIFDTKLDDTMIDMNDDLDESLTKPISRVIRSGEMRAIDADTIEMDIIYNNGDTATLIGKRDAETVTYFIDGIEVAQTSLEELKAYKDSRS